MYSKENTDGVQSPVQNIIFNRKLTMLYTCGGCNRVCFVNKNLKLVLCKSSTILNELRVGVQDHSSKN